MKKIVIVGADRGFNQTANEAVNIEDLKSARHMYRKEYIRTGNGTYRNMANSLAAIINEIEGTPEQVAGIALNQLIGGFQTSLKRTARPQMIDEAMVIELADINCQKDFGFNILPQREKQFDIELPEHLDEDVRIAIVDAVRDKLSKGATKLSSRRITNSLLSNRKDLLNQKEAIVILVDDILH